MTKPLLSICIPTYNRAEYLKKTIESIVWQEEFTNNKVEIVIADNASNDNTEEIGNYYSNLYDNVLYYRNVNNIGNNNFPYVLSEGKGVLKRLCNDTLCFNSGSLKYICEVIDRYKGTKPYICWLGNTKRNEIEELSFRDGIKAASFWITSIACFSIWENECLGIEKDTYGAELLLWQVRKSLELSSKKDSIVLVNKVLTSTQFVYKKDISYGLYHVFYENYFFLFKPYFDDNALTREDKEFLEKDLLLNFFPNWCVKWKLQNTTLQYSKTEDLCDAVYKQYHNKPYWNEYERMFKKTYLKLKAKDVIKKTLRRNKDGKF